MSTDRMTKLRPLAKLLVNLHADHADLLASTFSTRPERIAAREKLNGAALALEALGIADAHYITDAARGGWEYKAVTNMVERLVSA